MTHEEDCNEMRKYFKKHWPDRSYLEPRELVEQKRQDIQEAVERLHSLLTYVAEPSLKIRVEQLEEMGRRLNDIRNSIVAMQKFNFSEHAYPMVAALNEAGFEGMSYPEALEYYGSMLGRMRQAEIKCERQKPIVELARKIAKLSTLMDVPRSLGIALDSLDVALDVLDKEERASLEADVASMTPAPGISRDDHVLLGPGLGRALMQRKAEKEKKSDGG